MRRAVRLVNNTGNDGTVEALVAVGHQAPSQRTNVVVRQSLAQEGISHCYEILGRSWGTPLRVCLHTSPSRFVALVALIRHTPGRVGWWTYQLEGHPHPHSQSSRCRHHRFERQGCSHATSQGRHIAPLPLS